MVLLNCAGNCCQELYTTDSEISKKNDICRRKHYLGVLHSLVSFFFIPVTIANERNESLRYKSRRQSGRKTVDMIVVIYFGLMMRNLLIGQDGVASLRIPARSKR